MLIDRVGIAASLMSERSAANVSSDAELLARAAQHDDAAFVTLYQRHAPYVARVVFRLLGNDSDVDDIIQETFVDALSGFRTVTSPEALRGWLVTIAARKVRRLLGKRRRRAFLNRMLFEFAPFSSDPRDRRIADELYDALDRIAPDLRIPWVLNRVEQFTLPEVARVCGVSIATIKRRIADAEHGIERVLHRE